jgi:DNA-binding GntR family transcriptional regulator
MRAQVLAKNPSTMKTIASRASKMPATLRLPPHRRRNGETVGEYIFRRLRQAIIVGRFSPGMAVTIRGLAALLGTSPMPVREAMRRLVAEGALEQLDHGRACVPIISDSRFDALIEARILLETAAARRALPCIDAARLEDLRRLDRAMWDVFERGDIDRTIDANMAFHRRLYSFAPDDVLTPLIESIWLQIGPYMRAAIQGSRQYYRIDRHTEALTAIAAGDAQALARAVAADARDGIGHLIAGRPLKTSVGLAPVTAHRTVAKG